MKTLLYRLKVIVSYVVACGLKTLSRNRVPPFTATSALIVQKGSVLLIKRADGLGHCFPGGYINSTEQPADAIVREVKEETGYTIAVDNIYSAHTNTNQPCRYPIAVVITYLATITGGALRPSTEGIPVWFDLNNLPIDLLRETRKTLDDYLVELHRQPPM